MKNKKNIFLTKNNILLIYIVAHLWYDMYTFFLNILLIDISIQLYSGTDKKYMYKKCYKI